MGKDRNRRRTKGGFVQVRYGLMKSPAWRDLSGNAVKLLLHMMMLSQGNNGWGHGSSEPGKLFLSERDAAEAIGVSRNTASRAFAELIEHGFLRIVQAGHFKVKVKIATVWRLTFEPYPRAHQGPTNEWMKWQPEEKSRAQKLNGSGARIDEPLENDEFTGAETGPDKIENGENPPNASGSKTAPHLDMPWGDGVPEHAPTSNPPLSSFNSAGGQFGEIEGADAVAALRSKISGY
jgi:hypothetical protein